MAQIVTGEARGQKLVKDPLVWPAKPRLVALSACIPSGLPPDLAHTFKVEYMLILEHRQRNYGLL